MVIAPNYLHSPDQVDVALADKWCSLCHVTAVADIRPRLGQVVVRCPNCKIGTTFEDWSFPYKTTQEHMIAQAFDGFVHYRDWLTSEALKNRHKKPN